MNIVVGVAWSWLFQKGPLIVRTTVVTLVPEAVPGIEPAGAWRPVCDPPPPVGLPAEYRPRTMLLGRLGELRCGAPGGGRPRGEARGPSSRFASGLDERTDLAGVALDQAAGIIPSVPAGSPVLTGLGARSVLASFNELMRPGPHRLRYLDPLRSMGRSL